MDVKQLMAQIGIYAVTKALRWREQSLTRRQYDALIKAAIAELLKLHPDIDEAEARIRAAEAISNTPSAAMLRATSALDHVKSYGAPKKLGHFVKRRAAKKMSRKTYRPKHVGRRTIRKH